MTDCKPASTPMVGSVRLDTEDSEDLESMVPYRELVGSLLYLAVSTRPDIAHVVSALGQFNCNHKTKHWIAAKHVLRYLKGTMNFSLSFKRTQKDLIGYVDADWGNCRVDRRSYTGIVFIFAGGAISWESRKQRTVALSSTEAEYMGLTDAAKEAVYLITFLTELGLETMAKITLFNDNQGAKHLAHNPVYHGRSKHIDIRYNYIREVLQTQPIRLDYLPTEQMLADILTKGLPKGKHEFCVNKLGLAHRAAKRVELEGECWNSTSPLFDYNMFKR
ncbi:Copia protein [Cyphomyrmex costatus]|uniref:Copia protein n=1 Tax=Cyphomyrmex costatus TaxID=456900 RepID=A0A151I961_9HYME|nr:Copia protein [Cyphomyrmex costatus]